MGGRKREGEKLDEPSREVAIFQKSRKMPTRTVTSVTSPRYCISPKYHALKWKNGEMEGSSMEQHVGGATEESGGKPGRERQAHEKDSAGPVTKGLKFQKT